MNDENSGNEKILLYLFAGVGLTLFIYLFFKNTNQQSIQPMYQQSQLHSLTNEQSRTLDLEKEIQDLKDELKTTSQQIEYNKQKSFNYLNDYIQNNEQLKITNLEKETQSLRNNLNMSNQRIEELLQAHHNKNSKTKSLKSMDNTKENRARQEMFNMQ